MSGATPACRFGCQSCISSKELPKRQQDCSDKPGALSPARRDQEEFADSIEDGITLILTELLVPGLREQYARGHRGSVCLVACNQSCSDPRAVCVLVPVCDAGSHPAWPG